MARGQKHRPETIYAIMSSWAITNNYSETARGLNLAVSTVKKIVEENKNNPEFVKVCNEKKAEFSEKASDIIFDALERLHDDVRNKEVSIPVNHLTTVIGTLFDKRALADGNATDRVVIDVKLPEGIEEYAQ